MVLIVVLGTSSDSLLIYSILEVPSHEQLLVGGVQDIKYLHLSYKQRNFSIWKGFRRTWVSSWDFHASFLS